MDDVVKEDDVLVLELLHEGYFTDSGGRGAFFGIEVDLLQGDELARLAVAALENLQAIRAVLESRAGEETHRGIGSFAQLFQLLEGAGMSPVVHRRNSRNGLATA
jgi:hypothetical protein